MHGQLTDGRGFPTDFPMVGLPEGAELDKFGRGFPTDFPMVGCMGGRLDGHFSRGFPTDFPMVGSARSGHR